MCGGLLRAFDYLIALTFVNGLRKRFCLFVNVTIKVLQNRRLTINSYVYACSILIYVLLYY